MLGLTSRLTITERIPSTAKFNASTLLLTLTLQITLSQNLSIQAIYTVTSACPNTPQELLKWWVHKLSAQALLQHKLSCSLNESTMAIEFFSSGA